MGDRGASFHITYKKKDMPNIENFDIDVTAINVLKMKCEIKGTVDMKLQGG